MPQRLHELLATESSRKSQVETCRADLTNAFEKKRHLFQKRVITFKPAAEGAEPKTEEQLDLQTTVVKELRLLSDLWAGALDTSSAIAETNTVAKANVLLEGDTIPLLTEMPATALLELEKRLGEIQGVFSSIPTLDPAKGFRPDEKEGEGISRAFDEEKTRTQKVQEPIVLYPATDKHPAQTQLVSLDKPIGKIVTQEWSGLVTPAQKAEYLDRIEVLRRAVKAARARANEAEVREKRVGARLFRYILEGM